MYRGRLFSRPFFSAKPSAMAHGSSKSASCLTTFTSFSSSRPRTTFRDSFRAEGRERPSRESRRTLAQSIAALGRGLRLALGGAQTASAGRELRSAARSQARKAWTETEIREPFRARVVAEPALQRTDYHSTPTPISL